MDEDLNDLAGEIMKEGPPPHLHDKRFAIGRMLGSKLIWLELPDGTAVEQMIFRKEQIVALRDLLDEFLENHHGQEETKA